VGSYRITLHEADDQGLSPNEETKKLARIAQSNGKVVGHLGSRGESKILSTQDHPLIDKVDYQHETQIRSDVLLTRARELISNLKLKK